MEDSEIDCQFIMESHNRWVNLISSLYYDGKFKSGTIKNGKLLITQIARRISAMDTVSRSVEGFHYGLNPTQSNLDLNWSRTLSTPDSLYIFWNTNRIVQVTDSSNNPESNPKVRRLFKDAYWESISWFAPNFDRFDINSTNWLSQDLQTIISKNIPYNLKASPEVIELEYRIGDTEVSINWKTKHVGTISGVTINDLSQNVKVEYAGTNFKKIKEGVWLPYTVTRLVTSRKLPRKDRYWTIQISNIVTGKSDQISNALGNQFQQGSIVHFLDTNEYKHVPGGIDLLDINIEHAQSFISKSNKLPDSLHLTIVVIAIVLMTAAFILAFPLLKSRR
tara:strand:- start:379 stop:1383 length:1005 start_codon:yes stop_codon:yes gene_type:complete